MIQDELDALGREWHVAFHRTWTAAACGKPYVKTDWRQLDVLASKLIRAARVAPPYGLPMAGERVS